MRNKNKITCMINGNEYVVQDGLSMCKRRKVRDTKKLIDNKIFTAVYWPKVKECIHGTDNREVYLQENLITIPVDLRYSMYEFKETISFIK